MVNAGSIPACVHIILTYTNMNDKKQLKRELKNLKTKLSELVDFTTSEDFFKLSEAERGVINQQRVGMELYQSCLVKRVYGDINGQDTSNLLWMTMLFGMFNSSCGFGSSDTKELEKALEESKEEITEA